MNLKILKENNLIIPTYLIPIIKQLNLEFNDILLLIYIWNYKDSNFNVEEISKFLKLSEEEALIAFNNLLSKKIIKVESIKDEEGKREEVINLDFLYCMIEESYKIEEKKEKKIDIFTIFENEMGRPISSIEYEIINAWLSKGFSEELIVGALKEAIYNNVRNLRYIDKILYEWQKKGYKTMKDVNNNKYVRNEKNTFSNDVQDLINGFKWYDDNES